MTAEIRDPARVTTDPGPVAYVTLQWIEPCANADVTAERPARDRSATSMTLIDAYSELVDFYSLRTPTRLMRL